MVARACNPRTLETAVGGLEIPDHLLQHRGFKVSSHETLFKIKQQRVQENFGKRELLLLLLEQSQISNSKIPGRVLL